MPPGATTPASIISDAIASLTHAANVALSKSDEQAQAELSRALSDARMARNQRDEALNSLKTIESEQVNHKQQLDTWKTAVDQADSTIQHQADTIAQLRQENIHWRDQYARVEKSCQEWKEQFMRVEQERIRLLARLEELLAQQDSDNTNGSSLDEYARYGEHATSPPSSSASTKIGSASVDKLPLKRRQLEAVIIPNSDKASKASGLRKPVGKPSAGGIKSQTKTVTNATRPVKDKDTPKQKLTQKPEGFPTKGPTQKVIRRVHAIVEVPIKIEDNEDELVRTPVDNRKAEAPPDKDLRLSKVIKKATKSTGPPRTESKSWQVYRDNDATPPAHAQIPKRRKSGIDQDYCEPDEAIHNWRSLEEANVRHRPPSRRKSIRELRESDFEYREEDDDEETDTDELNLGQRGFEHSVHPEKPTKQQQANEISNAPTRKNGRKRKAVDAMDVDEPVASGRGAGKAAKMR
ncbi:hypothetical protein BDM02DRAFT_3122355 [Thelephora ganbajun]|uniref:Uncharacterized protein n=1 Tax=Thelephora ganbajun TaxID=370292 RepID=A0ACB6Z3N8_THEGA|nr:hypothetical protein BDM02DRAFT_3122355 [Thelephora ganbajun]